MVSRVSFRRWLLRDLPQAFMVLGCAGLIVGVFFYAFGWATLQHDAAVKPQLNNGNEEQRYTGSILLPVRRNLCWEGIFDNRTGRMIDNGSVNCNETARQLTEENLSLGMDIMRMRAVSKAFRNESN